MAKAKLKKKPVKRRLKTKRARGEKVVSKEIIKPISDKIGGKKKGKKRVKKTEVIIPEKPIISEKRKRGGKPAKKDEPKSFETSGGTRKKYFIVLEEETHDAFSLMAYRRQEFAPVLMNQIVKEATKANFKLSRKDVELWMDERAFDDGTDKTAKISPYDSLAPLVRPYDPHTKSYNRMRRRYTCILEEKVAEKFRKSIKTNLYGSYLINHLMRECLRGNLELKWTEKDAAEACKWSFSGQNEPITDHGGDLIPFDLGEPAAVVTHEWRSVLEEQRLAKEKEKADKPKRKRTVACPYPGCGGRAGKKVSAEDKKNIYYQCNKCKKTFTRTSAKKGETEDE